MATRKELTAAAGARYRTSDRAKKSRILDEFVDITGLHRKHAMRLLRGQEDAGPGRRARRRVYNEAEHNALVLLWEASDRICGKRLKALMPALIEAMERHGHLDLAPEIRDKLLAMSAATIDRALARVREGLGRKRRRHATHSLRRSIPIRTSADWNDPAPGFVEADLVAHSSSIGARQLHPDPRAHRHCYRLDGVRSSDRARTDTVEHGVDGIAQTIALCAGRPRYGQ